MTPGPLTESDLVLARTRMGGAHCELLDGNIVVNAEAGRWHDLAVERLTVLLTRVLPATAEVADPGADLRLDAATIAQPDVLVGIAGDPTGHPLLVVEVTSRPSRRLDRGLKLALYEAAAIPSYWVVDPLVPSLVAWHLEHGEYVEVASVVGDEAAELSQPFTLQVRPSGLGIE